MDQKKLEALCEDVLHIILGDTLEYSGTAMEAADGNLYLEDYINEKYFVSRAVQEYFTEKTDKPQAAVFFTNVAEDKGRDISDRINAVIALAYLDDDEYTQSAFGILRKIETEDGLKEHTDAALESFKQINALEEAINEYYNR